MTTVYTANAAAPQATATTLHKGANIPAPNALSQTTKSHRRTGLKACMADAWRLFARQPLRLIGAALLPLLVAGAGCTAALLMLTDLYDALIVPVRQAIFLGIPQSEAWQIAYPDASQVCMAIGALLLLFIAKCLAGATMWQIAGSLAATGAPEKVLCLSTWRKLGRMWTRNILYGLCEAFPMLVVTAGVLSAAIWIYAPIAFSLLIIYVYCFLVFIPGRRLYLCKSATLAQSLKHTFKVGHRSFGGLLLLVLLSAIPGACLAFSASLPFVTIILSDAANAASVLAGAPEGLPENFLGIAMGTGIVCYLVGAFVTGFYRIPVMLRLSEQ